MQSSFALKIRIAQPRDLKELVEVLSRSFYPSQTTMLGIQPLLRLGITEDIRGRIRSEKPNYRCLVAFTTPTTFPNTPRTLVGTVELALRNQVMAKQIPYISNLAVIPEYRRQGIARQLLLRCERIAREWGFKELSLHVLENNLAAQQLYFSNGYKLQKIEHSLSSWLFKQPKRLFLAKEIENLEQCCD
ncbi:GNAT family N-acetyltransferase [Aphanothece hegewaldii]|uniref:GNAT family N-acetyltransferase n=1 Tax=Aphanothece hegewaldii TaxID=1521625 RepID=UPI001FE8CE15|nr:GNAT family N-acetyltransferase [Aphanothece hegewaldii]